MIIRNEKRITARQEKLYWKLSTILMITVWIVLMILRVHPMAVLWVIAIYGVLVVLAWIGINR